MTRKTIVISFLASMLAMGGFARVLQVGAGCAYATPSAAAKMAQDGDTVEIAAGTYMGDVCAWTAKNLTIRGAGADRTILDAAGKCCQGKGTWIVKGINCRISGVTFRGAACPDKNGAGVRFEADGPIEFSRCRFTANENGILCGAMPNAVVKIDRCAFDRNGAGDGYSHNLYIGAVARLELTRSTSDHARKGHDLKSRAQSTVVSDCRFDDGADGESSYLLNCPNGGKVRLERCTFVQAPTAVNGTMVSVGEEGARPNSEVTLKDCTFTNLRTQGKCVELFRAPGVELRLKN